MNPRRNCCPLAIVFIFMFLAAGRVEGSRAGVNPLDLLQEGIDRASSRKLLGFNMVLDYDYAGPNPKHDSRAGKRGGGATKTP